MPNSPRPARLFTTMNTLLMVGCGFYLSRVAAEGLPGPRTLGQIAFLGIGGLVLAIAGTLLATRAKWPLWPWAFLWVYVLWPWRSPTLAGAVGTATLISWLWLAPPMRCPSWGALVGTLAGGLVLYGATAAPTVLPGDAGEFQLVATVLGIAHPPGYPLYTLLGKIATLLPLGDAAYCLNLLSSLLAALTLASIVGFTLAGNGKAPSRAVLWAGLSGAAMLAFSPTFWAQATTANIRSLTALCTALCLGIAIYWGQAPSARRLALLAFTFGLAVGHHSSLGLLALPLAAYLLAVDPHLPLKPREWGPALGAGILALSVLLYLPIRSAMHPPFDPVPIDSLPRFMEHISAAGFRGDMFYFRTLSDLIERARVYGNILHLQFGAVLPWLAALTLILIGHRNWRLGMLLGGTWLINALSALTYRAPQTVEYLLPSYVAMAMSLTYGLHILMESLPRASSALVLAGVSLLIIPNGLALWPDFQALHHDRSTRAYATAILTQAPESAIVLANWHWATPLWYLQTVEGLRPDIRVEYVYPKGALSNPENWLARIADALASTDESEGAVVVTNWYAAYENSPYTFEPLGEAWLVRQRPRKEPPPTAQPLGITLGERIQLEAVSYTQASLTPGDALRVTLYWRPIVPLERDYAVFVQIIGPQGVVGQADRAQPTSTYPPGTLRVDAYTLPLLLQTWPGEYTLIAGFYYTHAEGWERLKTPEGADHVVLGTVTVRPGETRMATQHALDVRYATGPQLRGMDLDHSISDQARLYLHWVGGGAEHPSPWEIDAMEGERILASAQLPPLEAAQTAVVTLDLPPGVHQIRLRLRQAGTDSPLPRLGPWNLPGGSSLSLRLPKKDQRYVPLGGEMAYVGLARPPALATLGEAIGVRPILMALRPLLRDYSLSAGIVGQGWERKDDGTPAMGAIPTLKWLSGWQVTSLLKPTVPPDAQDEQASLTLSVYDAFTSAPLAVLDERLARAGQGVYLIIGQVEIKRP